MKTSTLVQQSIRNRPYGKPFTSTALLKCGSRAAVDQALSRLVRVGEIIRLARGVYVRPEENRFVGKVLPEPFMVLKTIAKKTHETIQVSGAEAARQFGFTTQISAQPIFLTTGQSRRFKIGGLEMHLKHTSKKKIPFPGTKVGLAIVALWYLGKEQVTTQSIEKIKSRLTECEFEKLKASRDKMPLWMANKVLQYVKEKKIFCIY